MTVLGNEHACIVAFCRLTQTHTCSFVTTLLWSLLSGWPDSSMQQAEDTSTHKQTNKHTHTHTHTENHLMSVCRCWMSSFSAFAAELMHSLSHLPLLACTLCLPHLIQFVHLQTASTLRPRITNLFCWMYPQIKATNASSTQRVYTFSPGTQRIHLVRSNCGILFPCLGEGAQVFMGGYHGV